MILDTDVLSWFLRGNEKATEAVIEALPFSISIVIYMELLQGVRRHTDVVTNAKLISVLTSAA